MTPSLISTLTRYLAWIFALNLVWEFAQMPLYTLWEEGSTREIAFAAVHCTLGDVLIAAGALAVAWLIAGLPDWPTARYWPVVGLAIAVGLAVTVHSEWTNVYLDKSWAYSPLMPALLGIGVSPLLQWCVVPLAAFTFTNRQRGHLLA